MWYEDTVAAVSTPLQTAALGVVRVSGPAALSIVGQIFSGPVQKVAGGTALHGYIRDGQTLIDEVVVTVFRAPHSYTGEDVAEISCHGSPFILRCVMRLLIGCGARAASAGEFTKRAFINGKLDLTRAEAVADLINSETKLQAASAVGGLRGGIWDRIEPIRAELVGLAAQMLAFIDFPDDDISDLSPQTIRQTVLSALGQTQALAEGFDKGRVIRSGVRVCICGRPNAGKSTLMNRLLGCERSIVTGDEGTTRDVVEDSVVIDGVKFVLSDTAGIRRASSEAERIGVDRAGDNMRAADLLLCVFDASAALSDADRSFINEALACSGRKIAVLNKLDLGQAEYDMPGFDSYVRVSAARGDGAEELRRAMSELAGCGNLPSDGSVINNLRQYECVVRAAEALQRAADGAAPDAQLQDIEEAIDALGSLTGRSASEDIINDIFSRFCVGK